MMVRCRSYGDSTSAGMCWVVLFFLLLQGLTQGAYVVEERSLSVISPDGLAGKYDSATSSFGRPDYAGSLLGSLMYPKQGATACAPFSKFQIHFKKRDNDFQHPPIALLDRAGECDFAWKVFNAQAAGASGAIIIDSKEEPLSDMADDVFANPLPTARHIGNVTIPSVLVNKTLGDRFKAALLEGTAVNVKLDWTEAPRDPVNYEFWTISQDKCGLQCDAQVQFVKNFRGLAQNLEKGGYTVFTPHYIVWYCPANYIDTKECKSECINHGRYCSPDPESNFNQGYNGRDVVIENLRQLCIYHYLRDMKRPWVWWDFVTDFQLRCSMKESNYSASCADMVTSSLGIEVTKIHGCMGDTEADTENALLKAEQDGQVGKGGERGDITIAPTLVIENRQYKGKLDNGAVLKAMCRQFPEGSDPPLCLGKGLETNECLVDNGGCWNDSSLGVTACKDTFKGRVCECPFYEGVQFEGDGYTKCTPVGLGRCSMNNAGCWHETRGNTSFSACSEKNPRGCECPKGFGGDGMTSCVSVEVCKQKMACQCEGCNCTDVWGGYECHCQGDFVYISDNDVCVRRKDEPVRVFWFSFGILFLIFAVIGIGVAVGYKVRTYMDSRIRATLAQYMPLDGRQDDIYRHLEEDT